MERIDTMNGLASTLLESGDYTTILRFQGFFMDQIMVEYRSGLMSRESALEELSNINRIAKTAVTQLEASVFQEWQRTDGTDYLTTDTSGARTRDWFDSTGRAFATGIATACVICVVVNDEAGMAASHQNTVGHDEYMDWVTRALDNEHPFLPLSSESSIYGSVILAPSLTSRVEATIDQAFDRFSDLTTDYASSQTRVLVTGINYLEGHQDGRKVAIEAASSAIHRRTNATRISLQTIGSAYGIIYGGSNHPKYPIPTFYH